MAYPYDDDWPEPPYDEDEEDFIIIPDYETEDMPDDYDPYLVEEDWGYGGNVVIYWNAINRELEPVNRIDGIYTDIHGGYVSFGEERNNTRTVRCSIQPTKVDGYAGIAIDSPKLDVNAELPTNYTDFHSQIEVGSDVGLTGYLKAVVAIRATQSDGPEWIVYNIPFVNGICVWGGD